ncbi:MAG: YraN family protein [Prevotellaceae bacterium]|jgi:putative endonuclease|nr:YraN family protein [Prevotellaceae bacterium]
MQNKDATGSKGERLARKFLQDNKFVISHMNWRFGHKELDIIATKNNMLHIIEVKTRTSAYWKEPKSAVVKRKQKNMIAAAEAYISRENINTETQFDVISIVINGNEHELEYIPNAFVPSEI